jgi:hypothetical protein
MMCSVSLLQGAPLLATRTGTHGPLGHVHVPLIAGTALLPDLSITGSSEAILSGQKPPFALAARLVDREGRPVR